MNQNERCLVADYGNTADELLALIQKKYDAGSASSRVDRTMIFQAVEVARGRCEAAEMALEMFRAGKLRSQAGPDRYDHGAEPFLM